MVYKFNKKNIIIDLLIIIFCLATILIIRIDPQSVLSGWQVGLLLLASGIFFARWCYLVYSDFLEKGKPKRFGIALAFFLFSILIIAVVLFFNFGF